MDETNSPSADADKKPVSVAVRTVIGAGLIVGLGILLWLDHAGARLLPAGAAAPSILGQLLEDGLLMAAVAAVIVGVGLLEYARMARRLGARFSAASLAGVGVVLFLLEWAGWAYSRGHFSACPQWLREPGLTVSVGLCAVALGVPGLWAVRGRVEAAGATAGHFVMGLLYVMVPLGFIAGVRVRWGVPGVVTLLAVCKCTDIGAYYAGKTFGGPKLAPVVSPRKTWAGVAGAVVAACAMSVALSVVGWSGLGAGAALAYGVLMAAGAVVADLAESALKREAGIKDSGNLLPGSGGVLDMADDVLFAVPFTYVFFALAHA